jgi:uncharacterized membrane protein YcaP (DUF421 family)
MGPVADYVFDGWADIGRVLLVGTLAYAGLVLFVRISGKRTLAKMNAFDLVVTVALGSTLATVLLSKDVALAEGLSAFALLIALQYVVAIAAMRSKTVRRAVKSEPRLLARDGALLAQALKAERVTPQEVHAAIRSSGARGLHEVAAVVLETDGEFSVIKTGEGRWSPAVDTLDAGHGSSSVSQ